MQLCEGLAVHEHAIQAIDFQLNERVEALGELTINSGMAAITRAMQRPESGLEVRDRMWLKIKISNAFIGSEVVDWLYSNVDGFEDRRDARKYVTQMLKAGYIKHTVNKTTFSEQCYYTFCDDKFLAGSKFENILSESFLIPMHCTLIETDANLINIFKIVNYDSRVVI